MAYGLLADYLNGQCIDGFRYFGAHFENHDGVDGVMFRLYAPMADDVSVIGEWSNWDMYAHKMNKIDDCGVWELFIPGLKDYQCYKYHFKNAKGKYVDKADPYAFYSENRPATCSRLYDYQNYPWHDQDFMNNRGGRGFGNAMSIYEMHVGSWRKKPDGTFPSYEEVAEELIPYLKENGYTHVEIMPITQYPFDGSWGYQATGFFSVDARYGNPKQLMRLIDLLHLNGFGVILDFVLVHFAIDKYALIEYDGTRMFEYKNRKNTFSQWGSALFDLGKNPVRSFLMSAVNYFLCYYHFDGVRVDAVSNIIYWHGDKSKGENSGAVEFIKRLNAKIHIEHNDVMMIAEDSSDYQGVTKPTEYGGLGFDYKWDLGWMNDTLKYYAKDPIYRKYDHHMLTFSMAYFYSENFLLPLSHDEVVHGKGTIINKMWGDYNQKFQQIRNLYTYMWAHPGKKLNFMGNELGTFDEWNENKSLTWDLLRYPIHDSLKRMVRDLNLIYQSEPAMKYDEYNPNNFHWLMVDNCDQSVYAFERSAGDNEVLVFIFNMTPNYYDQYDVGVNRYGTYVEIFNSDKDVYGGYNNYNGKNMRARKNGPENRPYKITIKLASFGAMILKLKK